MRAMLYYLYAFSNGPVPRSLDRRNARIPYAARIVAREGEEALQQALCRALGILRADSRERFACGIIEQHSVPVVLEYGPHERAEHSVPAMGLDCARNERFQTRAA